MRKATILFSLAALIGWWGPAIAATAAPEQPLGIKGITNHRLQSFTLMWDDVKQRNDGRVISGKIGYNVYKRSSPDAAPSKINSYLLPVPVFADRLTAGSAYYSVRAVDEDGNESADSFTIDSKAKPDGVFLASEGDPLLTIPAPSSRTDEVSVVLRDNAP